MFLLNQVCSTHSNSIFWWDILKPTKHRYLAISDAKAVQKIGAIFQLQWFRISTMKHLGVFPDFWGRSLRNMGNISQFPIEEYHWNECSQCFPIEMPYLIGGFKHCLLSISYMGSSFPLTFIFFKMVIASPTSDYKMGEFPGSHV